MKHKTVEKYILSLPNVILEYPFGEEVAVYRVFAPTSAPHLDAAPGSSEERAKRTNSTMSEKQSVTDAAMRQKPAGVGGSADKQGQAVRGNWKMFALIQEGKQPVRLSLKCDPLLAETLRAKYESVLPGYHLNKKHWNTLILSGQLAWPEVQDLIRHSYNLVVGV